MTEGGEEIDLIMGLLAKLFSRRYSNKRWTSLESVGQPKGSRPVTARKMICTPFLKS